MLRRLMVCFGCFGTVVAACGGGPTSIDLGAYDRSCKNANDCVAVTTDACCGCADGAINKADLARYQADVDALSKNCTQCTAKPCAAIQPGCAAGVCTTGYVPDAGGDDAGADAATDASGDASSGDASSDAANDAPADAADDAQDAASE